MRFDNDTYPNLVRPTRLGKVSHPLDTVVVALFKYLQEADNKTGCGEHEYLEVNIDGRPSPDLSGGGASKLSMTRECDFRSSLDARDSEVTCHLMIEPINRKE